jgi:hypothetical protein
VAANELASGSRLWPFAAPPSTRTLIVAFTLLHILLSVWMNATIQINNDGTRYVTAARAYAAGQFADARALYGWPAYSMVIGALSALTGFDAHGVARVLNIAASTVTFLLLLRVLRELTAGRVVLICGALLLFGNLWWNDVRGAIIREHLFLMFMAAGLYLQMRDLARPRIANQLGFVAAGVLAAAFRIEALAFVVLVPLFRLIVEVRKPVLRYGLILAACIGIALVPFGLTFWTDTLGLPSPMAEVRTRIEALKVGVLAPFEMRQARLAYVSIVIGLVLVGFIKALGLANIALAAYAARYAPELDRRVFRIVGCYLAAGLIVFAVQVFLRIFFDPRHGLLLSLALPVPAAFGFAALLRRRKGEARDDRFTRILGIVVVALLIFGFVRGLTFYDANRFVRTAGAWMAANIPPASRVLSNSPQLLFYSGFRSDDFQFLIAVDQQPSIAGIRDWKNYDYVALHLRQSRLHLAGEVERALGSAPIATFINGRGDKIFVFRAR